MSRVHPRKIPKTRGWCVLAACASCFCMWLVSPRCPSCSRRGLAPCPVTAGPWLCSPGPSLELIQGDHLPAPAESVSESRTSGKEKEKSPRAPQAPQRAPARRWPKDIYSCGCGSAVSAWHQRSSDACFTLCFLLRPLQCHLPPPAKPPPVPTGTSATGTGISTVTSSCEEDDMEITAETNHQDLKDGITKCKGICLRFKNPSASWAQCDNAPAVPSFALKNK